MLRCSLLLVVVVLLASSGCGSTPPSGPAVDSLKVLADHYGRYAVTNKGQGPADEKAFHAYFKELGRQEAASGAPVNTSEGVVGVAPASATKDGVPARWAAHLSSPRDNQPFTIVYGLTVSFAAKTTQVIAHETTGVNGKQLVVFANGEVEEVTPDQLAQYKQMKE
jgi:hypothetical protein